MCPPFGVGGDEVNLAAYRFMFRVIRGSIKSLTDRKDTRIVGYGEVSNIYIFYSSTA